MRNRATSTQTALDRDARKSNVEGAFVLRRDVEGEDVWLIDDVVTTGATVDACSQVLIAGGVRSVDVVAVASPYDKA